jgi:hypothetical protein
MSVMGPPHPGTILSEWIDEVGRIRRRTRTLRQGFWLPLVLFGGLIMVAASLYGQTVAGTTSRGVMPGARLLAHSEAIALYWLISLPLGYALVGLWYWRRRQSRGVATSVGPFVAFGLALVALAILSSPSMLRILHLPVAAAVVRTLGTFGAHISNRSGGPFLVIGLSLIILSYLERSWVLAVFLVGYLGLAVVPSFYDLGNLTSRLGWNVGTHEAQLAVFLAGLYLHAGGLVVGLTHRSST